jgi:hypothetical protein
MVAVIIATVFASFFVLLLYGAIRRPDVVDAVYQPKHAVAAARWIAVVAAGAFVGSALAGSTSDFVAGLGAFVVLALGLAFDFYTSSLARRSQRGD